MTAGSSLMYYDESAVGGYNSDDEEPATTNQGEEDVKEYLRWRQDNAEKDPLSDWTIQIVTTTATTDTTATASTQPLEASSATMMEKAAAAAAVVHDTDGQEEAQADSAVVVQTYHVHRYALATGPRRSEYFVRLFQQTCFAESQTCTSRIRLEQTQLTAPAFSILLDFLYAPAHVLPVPPFTTENATALYSLAKYFDIPRLRWLSKQFWKVNVESRKTCGMYYQHAKLLQEDSLLQVAIRAIGKHVLLDGDNGDHGDDAIASILNLMKGSSGSAGTTTTTGGDNDDDTTTTGASSDLPDNYLRRHLLDAHFWQHYLPTTITTTDGATTMTTTTTTSLSWKLSRLLAEFFRLTSSATLDMLQEFTAPQYLPHIHVEAALLLLDTERKLLAELQQQDQDTNTPTESKTVPSTTTIATTTTTTEQLSSLQERCIHALAQKWDGINLDEEPHQTLLQQQPAHVVYKIYSASLATAKVDKQEVALERDRLLAQQCQQQGASHPKEEAEESSTSSSPVLFSFGSSARSADAARSNSMNLRSSRPRSFSERRRFDRIPPHHHQNIARSPPGQNPRPSLHHWWFEEQQQQPRPHDLLLGAEQQRQLHLLDDDDDDT